MLQFSHDVPHDGRGQSLDLIRAPARGVLNLIMTSERMIGTKTHFWMGRTTPCGNAECPACDEGLEFRWHSYLSAITTKPRNHILFEFTRQAAEYVKNYYILHGTLRGHQLVARRNRNKHNGRVILQLNPADTAHMTLPTEPNIQKILCKIWNIPYSDIEEVQVHPAETGLYKIPKKRTA